MILLSALALAGEPVLTWDLEGADGGFEVGGDLGAWEWGKVEAGPGGSWNGQNAWSTSLTGDYFPESTETLRFPLPDLGGVALPSLRLMSWYAFGEGDGGWLEVDDGAGWVRVDPVYGYPTAEGWFGASAGWEEQVVDLSPYSDSVQARLVFTANEDTSRGAGWFIDEVGLYDGDVAAPHLTGLTELADTMEVLGPYAVYVTAIDDTAVTTVTLRWSTDAGGSGEVAMAGLEAGQWLGAIPGVAPDTIVSYSVVADDGVQSARLPTVDRSFRVYLPAPTNLEAPAGRVLAQTATLRWRPPAAPYDIAGYTLYQDGTAVASASPTDQDGDGWISGEVPLTGVDDRFTVRATFTAGADSYEGDASDEVEVEAAVPTIGALTPDAAYAGDTLRVTLTGSFLLFTEGEVEAHLGAGVVVTDVEVQDVDTARLSLVVSADAEAGFRDLSLTTPAGTLTAPGAFEILPEADRPRLVDVTPTSIHQGDSGTFSIAWSGDLGDSVTVDLGEGIVVESVTRGDTLDVAFACLSNAPIGAHAVTVDDGTRVLDGVSVEVQDQLIAVQGCSVGVAPRWSLALLALLFLRRR